MIATLLLALMLQLNPESPISQIGVDQNLGRVVDPDIPFVDEEGRPVKLGDYFAEKPIVLTPVYFSCPMLCSLELNGLLRALRVLPLTAGKDFEIVTFSIDPNETPQLARSKKEHYVRDYGRADAGSGWHFLTGTPESIERITRQIGYRYTYDKWTRQWAHASALMILTPDGRLSQYFHGVEFDAGELKFSLIQASDMKIGSFVDHVLLYCFEYDPRTGKYSLAIMRIIRLLGVVTVLGLAAFMFTGFRRGKTRVATRV